VWAERTIFRRVRNVTKRDLLAASCPFVRPHEITLARTGRILIELGSSALFENLSRKFKFHKNPTRITGILHENFHIYEISLNSS
jgi:hypothetical protein